MDGVLVDFVRGVDQYFGISYDEFPETQEDLPIWNWYTKFGITNKQVNDICISDFWLNLEWMYDGKEILKLVESFFGDNVFLLTCPMPNQESWTGKYLWIEKHLPQCKKRIIITHLQKSMFASEGRLLIDDKDDNKDDFVSAGGDAILVPRPWNRLSQFQTVTYLKRELMKRF